MLKSYEVEARSEVWPLREAFTISRGTKTAAHVVVVKLRYNGFEGRGESVPYPRYGESVERVLDDIRAAAKELSSHEGLQRRLKPGAARNALDCAWWDLKSKLSGLRVAALADLPEPRPQITAFTLSLDEPKRMAVKAVEAAAMPLLKLKLGGAADDERIKFVRAARPDARIVVDANEAWGRGDLDKFISVAAECGVEMIEQPLPAGYDDALARCRRTVPICADESVHTATDLPRIVGRYDAVNVKLDKAGGLTGAIELMREARHRGLKVMVGSMVATSLAVAPAMLIAGEADWIDLDGPLLLARDREPGLRIEDGRIFPPEPELWG